MNCACYAVNASDITPVLIMLGADIVTTERTVPAAELFTTNIQVQQYLSLGELVKAFEIPKAKGEAHYDKRRVRDAIDFAIVSLASDLEVEDGVCKSAKLVLGGVAPVPYPVPDADAYLAGKKLTKETAKEAAAIALRDAVPMAENEYKVFIAKDVIYNRICEAAGIKQEAIPVL